MPSAPHVARTLARLTIIVFTLGSNVEPVLGLVRDGGVHHESPVAAVAHQAAGGDHGHEDVSGPTTDPQHDLPHQHGTAADHCTHAHGAGLPTSIVVAFAAPTVGVEDADHTPDATGCSPIRIPPPRV